MGNTYDEFKQDLLDGQEVEELAREKILKYYLEKRCMKFTTGEVQDKHNFSNIKYDFELIGPSGERRTFEVKQNKQVNTYGCYFFEIVDQFRRPSGLSTTNADFHVLVTGNKDEFVVIRTKYIENIIRILKEDHKLKVVRSTNGTVGYVIQKNMILKFQEFSVN
jgi:hypothetical protein